MLRTVTPALRSLNKQNPNDWAVTSFLSPDGMELITDTTTMWDKDGDLVLQKDPNFVSIVDLTILRFVRPIDNYQFIEIDVYSINDNKYIEVAFVNDYAHFDPTNGSYARATVPFTIGRVKTFRFPYIGEIEALAFKGFTSTGSFIVKDVRFFSRPPQFQLLPPIPPNEIALQFGFTYAELIQSYSAYQRPYQSLGLVYNFGTGQYEFTFYEGPTSAGGFVEFAFIWEALSLGLLRVGILQEGLNGIGHLEIKDQLEDLTIRASSDVMEFLVTLEKPRVDFRAFFSANTLPPYGMTFFFQAFMIEELVDTSVFGLRMPRMGANQQVENHMMNLRGVKGDKGDPGPQGTPGIPGNPGAPGIPAPLSQPPIAVQFDVVAGTTGVFHVGGVPFRPRRIEFRAILVTANYMASSEGSCGPVIAWDIVAQAGTPSGEISNASTYMALALNDSHSGYSPHAVHIIDSIGDQLCLLDVDSFDADGCTMHAYIPTTADVIVRGLFFP